MTKVPAPFVVHETVPVGLRVPLAAVTVATQAMLLPYVTTGVPAPQLTLVVVAFTST
jgi:hypothetical protein